MFTIHRQKCTHPYCVQGSFCPIGQFLYNGYAGVRDRKTNRTIGMTCARVAFMSIQMEYLKLQAAEELAKYLKSRGIKLRSR